MDLKDIPINSVNSESSGDSASSSEVIHSMSQIELEQSEHYYGEYEEEFYMEKKEKRFQ